MTSDNPIANLERLVSKGKPTAGEFQKVVLSYFKQHGRELPWRRTRDPYKILVSEVMLQQTQVERVVERYKTFIREFPSWRALSEAAPREVIAAWMGLGYYRRALNLHRAARHVCGVHRGRAPQTVEGLRELPGVGEYTAAAVAAFAYGAPAPMIETNIRALYLYVYFPKRRAVSDKEIMGKVQETVYGPDPRTWFYALMDLGSDLKRRVRGINRRSRHHVRQSPFKGSQREARAAILRLLTHQKSMSRAEILRRFTTRSEQAERALASLLKDELVRKNGSGRLVVVE